MLVKLLTESLKWFFPPPLYSKTVTAEDESRLLRFIKENQTMGLKLRLVWDLGLRGITDKLGQPS